MNNQPKKSTNKSNSSVTRFKESKSKPNIKFKFNNTGMSNTNGLPSVKKLLNTNDEFHSTSQEKIGQITNNNPSERTSINFMRFSHNNMFNLIDVDNLKDQILKLKTENNRKAKELSLIKKEKGKLEEDNKKNIRVMEEILNEAGKSATDIINKIHKSEERETINNIDSEFVLSTNSFIRLREIYVISSLKKQVTAMRQLIEEKDEEIESFRLNSKIMKYAKLEYHYSTTNEELNLVKKDYDQLKSTFEDTLVKYSEATEEKDYTKMALNRMKIQFEDAKTKVKNLEEDNRTLNELKKANEDKILHLNRYLNITSRINKKEKKTEGTKDVNSEISNLTMNLEKYKMEKSKLDRKIVELIKENKSYKEKVENKNETLQKTETNLKKINDDFNTQISKLQNRVTQVEKENDNLKKEKESLMMSNKEVTNVIHSLKNEIDTQKEISSNVNEDLVFTLKKENSDDQKMLQLLREQVDSFKKLNEELKLEVTEKKKEIEVYEVKIKEISGTNNMEEEPKTNKVDKLEKQEKQEKLEKHETKEMKVDEINNKEQKKEEIIIINPHVEEDIISETRKKEMDLINEQIKKKDLSNITEEPKAKSGFFKTAPEKEELMDIKKESSGTKFNEENFENHTDINTDTNIIKNKNLPEATGKSNESFKSADKTYKVSLSISNHQLDQSLKNTDEIYVKELQKIADNTNFDLNFDNQIKKNKSAHYLIKIEESEPQVLVSSNHYYTKNFEPVVVDSAIKKYNSNMSRFKPPVRTSTMETKLTEQIMNKQAFDKLVF